MTPPSWWPGGDVHADRLPISALEHYAYCPRQAGLIHLDNVFSDNTETMRGNVAHAHVHEPARPLPPTPPAPGRVRQVTGLQVWSDQLGLYGICDVVEIGPDTAVPVEHKVGRYVPGGPADLQAGAQALCLREMLHLDVPHAEVFSHADRRRHLVELTDTLTARIIAAADGMRAVLDSARLPAAVNDRRCRACSLKHDCLPTLTATPTDIALFIAKPLGRWDG